MIWTITKREFLSNLMTFRFSVASLLSLVLVVLFTWVLVGDYQRALKGYNDSISKDNQRLKQVKVYRQIQPVVYKPPEQLRIFCEGLEKRLGSSVVIRPREIPLIKPGYYTGNPLLAVFPTFDLSLVFKLVMSLLALLLAYDAVVGEKEQGTLGLSMSNNVTRYHFLLGKLIAGLLTLVLPILLGFIAGLLVLQLSPLISLSASDWIRISLIFGVSFLFVATMFNLGLLFSCTTKKASMALMYAIFFWVIFVIVIPNASAYLATQLKPVESREKIDQEVKMVWDKFRSEQRDFSSKLPSPQGPESDAWGPWGWFVINGTKSVMEYKRQQYAFSVPLQMDYADKVWNIEQGYLNSLNNQKKMADNLSRLSPISVYEKMVSALSGTDLGSYDHFVQRMRTYREEVMNYLSSKTKRFSSLSYFTVANTEDIEAYTKAISANLSIDYWKYKTREDFPPLTLHDFPTFDYKPEDVGEIILRIIPDLLILIMMNVLFFTVTFVAFLKYDPR